MGLELGSSILAWFYDRTKLFLSKMSKILISESEEGPRDPPSSEAGDLPTSKEVAAAVEGSSTRLESAPGSTTPVTPIRMGSEEDPKEYDELRKVFYRIVASGSVLGALVLILLVFWVLNFGGGFDWNDPGGSVNIHIAIMVFFIVYLHGHASLIYRILPTQPKYAVKLMHAGLHLSACIGSAVGLAAAVQSHNLKKTAHFYSLHSWLGIAAISLYYLQFLGGFLTFLVPVTPINIRLLALPIHRFVGQSLFTLCTAATVTGIMLKAIGSLGNLYPTLPPAAMVLNFAGLIVICFSIAIGNGLTEYRFRRRPRPGPEGELLLRGGGAGDANQSDQAE